MASASKYHARRTEHDGRVYASAAEARRAAELQLLEKAGEIKHVEYQPSYPLVVNGVKVGTYVADFTYWTRDGRFVVEDVKGVRTPTYRLKARLFRAVHGFAITEVRA